MTSRPHPPPTVLLLLAMVWSGPGLAAERSCPSASVDASSEFRERFPELLSGAERELQRTDIDGCARVTLREDDASIVVAIALPDGRMTSRSVAQPDDVIPTLQALLLVPVATRSVSDPPRAPAPVRRAPPIERAPVGRADVVAPSLPPRELGFELSLGTGARIGDGQLALGVGALSLLEVKSWLFGFEGRADRYRPLAGGDSEMALELGLLGGKRFDFGSVALDLTLGPAVAIKGLAMQQSDIRPVEEPPVMPPPPMPREDPTTGPVPRLRVGARLGFSPRSVFRTFVGIDGELGPSRAAGASPGGSRLPTYLVGLTLGATVGTR